MREPAPLFDPREGDSTQARPAEAATDVGADDDHYLSGSDWLETLLFVIAVVAAMAIVTSWIVR